MRISTEREYENALARVDKLWDTNIPELNELINAIETYEEIHYPIPAPSLWGRFCYWLDKRYGIVL